MEKAANDILERAALSLCASGTEFSQRFLRTGTLARTHKALRGHRTAAERQNPLPLNWSSARTPSCAQRPKTQGGCAWESPRGAGHS